MVTDLNVLLVESVPERAHRWARPLHEFGWTVHIAPTSADAITLLDRHIYRVIVLNLELRGGEALSVPVYAGYRHPEAQVVVVSGSGMFHDGSIFGLCGNACAYLSAATDPADLAALVDHHGRKDGTVRTPEPGGVLRR